MPFWISLLSSVLLVVNASNEEFHNLPASSMSPVSSHRRVPVSRSLRHSGSSLTATAGLPNWWANPSRANACTLDSKLIMANASVKLRMLYDLRDRHSVFVAAIRPRVKPRGVDEDRTGASDTISDVIHARPERLLALPLLSAVLSREVFDRPGCAGDGSTSLTTGSAGYTSALISAAVS